MKRFVILLIILGFMLGGTALAPALHSDGNASPRVTKIGFVGDSITAGAKTTHNAVQSEIATLGSGYEAVNRGMNGATTTNWLPGGTYLGSTLQVFRSEGVKIVSVMLGVNDASYLKLSPEKYADNMHRITAALLDGTGVRLVVLNYPTYVQRDSDTRPQIARNLEAYTKELDKLANGSTIVVGDTKAYDYFKSHPDELIDGIHPTDAGYKMLGELWAEALQRALAAHPLE